MFKMPDFLDTAPTKLARLVQLQPIQIYPM